MAKTILVDVVSSEESIFSGGAEYVVAPAMMGEIGIYPNHIPLICKLKSGVLRIKLPDQDEQLILAISGGFLEVHANKLSILADVVERTDELDEAKLIEQKQQALARLKHADSTMDDSTAKAYASLALVTAQLNALAFKHRKGKKSQ